MNFSSDSEGEITLFTSCSTLSSTDGEVCSLKRLSNIGQGK